MRIQTDNPDLRVALDLPEGTDRWEHSRLIADIGQRYPHTVVQIAPPGQSTCAMHAFGLTGEPVYEAIARHVQPELFAGRDFMEWVCQHRLQEIGYAVTGALALYFENGVWRHIGVVAKPPRITSKWGLFPVYEHDIDEVPARYGNEVRFFEAPAEGQGLNWFLDYAEAHGLSADKIDYLVGLSR
jgi:hypothetical protein